MALDPRGMPTIFGMWNPAAIIWAVIFIVVDAIKTEAIRTSSHVFQKCGETGLPARTHLDALRTVNSIFPILFSVTTRFRGAPCSMFFALRKIMDSPLSILVCQETTATARMPGAKIPAVNFRANSAATLAIPVAQFLSFWRLTFNDETAKRQPGQIDRFHSNIIS